MLSVFERASPARIHSALIEGRGRLDMIFLRQAFDPVALSQRRRKVIFQKAFAHFENKIALVGSHISTAIRGRSVYKGIEPLHFLAQIVHFGGAEPTSGPLALAGLPLFL